MPTLDSVHSNPHLRQVTQQNCGYESRTDIEFSRVLESDAPRLKYRRRRGELKTVIHWGQRKLLLSEIEFLTMYCVPGATVVYAGAAPGTHTPYLLELFPDLKFVLVDPAPFSSKLTEGPRCSIRQELFTDELAREFETTNNTLFLCDIRSCDWPLDNEQEIEDKVLEDMQAQQRWHDIIKPIKSMLKFRLPWDAGNTEYLAGDVYLPVFGPGSTSETRLIPHGHDRINWDNQKYEEQMFHFNTVTRVARYPHKMPVGAAAYGLDYCYDCRSEVQIILQYLHRTQPELQGGQMQQKFIEMTWLCGQASARNRTLMDANPDQDEVVRAIRSRQWINGKPAYHADNMHPTQHNIYSDTARTMMTKMGFTSGSGLGPRGQGTSEPIAASARFRRRGLGFAVPSNKVPSND